MDHVRRRECANETPIHNHKKSVMPEEAIEEKTKKEPSSMTLIANMKRNWPFAEGETEKFWQSDTQWTIEKLKTKPNLRKPLFKLKSSERTKCERQTNLDKYLLTLPRTLKT